MALAGSNFMPRNKLPLPISTSKIHPQKHVKIICGAPPRKEESEGRTPKINYVLTGTERSMTLTPMENTVAAVGSLKSNSEEAAEDNSKTRAKFSAYSTVQTQATD
ncbi:hypothetical protein OWV82_005186 [Melia azedarach]|uniref:Uncharacterized protein n=1 Tax=Melia azedarach TaxID=155640 RepID=A0ACC1YRY1_MELAZ|nr:hypothetical protein OWV82_005186 [Melia azedarach]